jgi:hypothetical protein
MAVVLLYPKHTYNESDVDVIELWGETPIWQYFYGNECFEHQWPCVSTHLGSLPKALGEEGVKELSARTMAVVVSLKLIAKKEFTRLNVVTTVQEKAVGHPTVSNVLQPPGPRWWTRPRLSSTSTSRPTPKKAIYWATRLGVTTMPVNSNGGAMSSNAITPSTGGCSAGWPASWSR